jgi:hypothetical protein
MNVIREQLEGKVQSWTIELIKQHRLLDGTLRDDGKLMTLEAKITSQNHRTSSPRG